MISSRINDSANLLCLSWNAYIERRLGDTLPSRVMQFNLLSWKVFVWKWVVFFSVLFLSGLSGMTAGKCLPVSFLNLAVWERIYWNADFCQNYFNLLGQGNVLRFHSYLLFYSIICVLSCGLNIKVMDTYKMTVETRFFSEL